MIDGIDVHICEVLASTKGNPYICSWMLGKQCVELANDDHNNISIRCAHQAGGRASGKSILQVKKYSGVRFFMPTKRHAAAGDSADHCSA